MNFGSVEAGGTKFVCAVGNEQNQVLDSVHFATTKPDETLSNVISYFRMHPVGAIGLASFGPLELNPARAHFGYITDTPKSGWRQTAIAPIIHQALHVPVFITTDVNGSAFGEYKVRHLDKSVASLVYYTVGTGVGAGIVQNGKFIGRLGHPEMGHVFVKRHPADLNFKGICPFHGDCLEGLISGPSIQARKGVPGQKLQLEDPVWEVIGYYLSQALLQVTLTIRPDSIVIGGGVASPQLIAKTRDSFAKLLNGYVQVPPLEQYISLPEVAHNGSATRGDFSLAKIALCSGQPIIATSEVV